MKSKTAVRHGKNKGRNKIPRPVWELLVEAFRRYPGEYAKSARVAGVDQRTAKRAWEEGLPHYPYGNRPIREIVKEEQHIARAHVAMEVDRRVEAIAEKRHADNQERLEEDKEDAAAAAQQPMPPTEPERAAARMDAVASRVQEAQVVRGARGNVAALIAMNANLLRGMVDISKVIKVKMTSSARSMTIVEGLKYARQLAAITRDAAQSAEITIDMERKLLGGGEDPVEDEDQVPIEEAVREIEEANEALQRARKAGIDLSVVEGGKTDTG